MVRIMVWKGPEMARQRSDSGDDVLAGLEVGLRRKDWGWRAFILVPRAGREGGSEQIDGDAPTPQMALVALGCALDEWLGQRGG